MPFGDFSNVFEKILRESIQFGQKVEVKKDLEGLFESLNDFDDQKVTPAQRFIRQIAEKTELFLRTNKNVIIAPADKGGKVIIMERETYDSKVREHLEANLSNRTYYHWKGACLDDCRRILEPMYDKIRLKINPHLLEDSKLGFPNTCRLLNKEPYVIARLFILLKVHKPNLPPRPIIAAPDCWANELSSWILKKLEKISTLFDDIKVRSAEEFIHGEAKKKLKGNGHRLQSWDYDSMFTNIPFPFVKKIILENYDVIALETTVPATLFIEAVSFLIEFSCYFIFKNEIFRQTKGLTMGNRISQVLADIATNYATKRALNLFRNEDISFIVKYVDDFAVAMEESIINKFEKELISPMKCLKVKRVGESEKRCISFLDTLIIRNTDRSVETMWWQKECSSRQILNFHSYHSFQIKRNVVAEYIRHALSVTSPRFFRATISNLRKNLKRSSYPTNFSEPIIKKILSRLGSIAVTSSIDSPDESFDFGKELAIRKEQCSREDQCLRTDVSRRQYILGTKGARGKNDEQENKFISMPLHNMGIMNKAKRIVRKHSLNCRLTPKIINSNKNKIFSKLKDKISLSDVKYAMYVLKCNKCDFSMWFRTSNLDVLRSASTKLNCMDSTLASHVYENSGHFISSTPVRVVRFQSPIELSMSFNQLSERGSVNAIGKETMVKGEKTREKPYIFVNDSYAGVISEIGHDDNKTVIKSIASLFKAMKEYAVTEGRIKLMNECLIKEIPCEDPWDCDFDESGPVFNMLTFGLTSPTMITNKKPMITKNNMLKIKLSLDEKRIIRRRQEFSELVERSSYEHTMTVLKKMENRLKLNIEKRINRLLLNAVDNHSTWTELANDWKNYFNGLNTTKPLKTKKKMIEDSLNSKFLSENEMAEVNRLIANEMEKVENEIGLNQIQEVSTPPSSVAVGFVGKCNRKQVPVGLFEKCNEKEFSGNGMEEVDQQITNEIEKIENEISLNPIQEVLPPSSPSSSSSMPVESVKKNDEKEIVPPSSVSVISKNDEGEMLAPSSVPVKSVKRDNVEETLKPTPASSKPVKRGNEKENITQKNILNEGNFPPTSRIPSLMDVIIGKEKPEKLTNKRKVPSLMDVKNVMKENLGLPHTKRIKKF